MALIKGAKGTAVAIDHPCKQLNVGRALSEYPSYMYCRTKRRSRFDISQIPRIELHSARPEAIDIDAAILD